MYDTPPERKKIAARVLTRKNFKVIFYLLVINIYTVEDRQRFKNADKKKLCYSLGSGDIVETIGDRVGKNLDADLFAFLAKNIPEAMLPDRGISIFAINCTCIVITMLAAIVIRNSYSQKIVAVKRIIIADN